MTTLRGSILCLCVALGCGRDASPPENKHGDHGRKAAPTKGEPPKPALTDNAYDLELRVDPPPSAGTKSRMVFDPRTQAGERVPELAIVHEKPLHFLFVSRDLSFFAHEHPVPQPDGTLAIELEFPPAGEYLAFADFTPKGATPQIVRKPVTVAGDAAEAKPLVLDDRSKPKAFGDFRVALGPAVMAAGGSGAMLEFVIQRGDAPVKELRPYLGAMGHCVIISEDTTEFLHSHPQEEQGPKAHVVAFHTTFPKPGKYKVWGQFDVAGEMLIADYVVEVVAEGTTAGAAPTDPHEDHLH